MPSLPRYAHDHAIRNHLDDCDAWRQANAFAEVGAFCAAEEGQQMSPERVRRAAVRRYLADHRQVTAIRLQFIDLVTAKGVG